MSLNKAMIIGNLGRDPEMRYTPNGQAVTQFTVAVNRNYKDANGEWKEETEWFRVVAWGPLAERTAEYLRKGRKVYVEGRLQTRKLGRPGRAEALHHGVGRQHRDRSWTRGRGGTVPVSPQERDPPAATPRPGPSEELRFERSGRAAILKLAG